MANKKVLYVEDSQDNQMLVTLFLRNEPVDLITADSPKEALDIVTSQQMDLVIVDLNLQENGDGAEIIRSIRKLPGYEAVPVFVFSGHDEHHFKQYAIDDMIQCFFRKPTNKNTLIEAIRKFGDIE